MYYCEVAEHAVPNHFRDATKMVGLGTVHVLSGIEQRCRNIVPMYAQ